MSILDLLLVALVAVGAIRGFRRGATVEAAGLTGGAVALGLALLADRSLERSGLRIAPAIALGAVLVCGLAGAVLAGAAARPVRRLLGVIGLRPVDGVLGAVIHGAVVLAVCWLLAAVALAASVPHAAALVDGSAVLHRVGAILGPPAGLLTPGR